MAEGSGRDVDSASQLHSTGRRANTTLGSGPPPTSELGSCTTLTEPILLEGCWIGIWQFWLSASPAPTAQSDQDGQNQLSGPTTCWAGPSAVEGPPVDRPAPAKCMRYGGSSRRANRGRRHYPRHPRCYDEGKRVAQTLLDYQRYARARRSHRRILQTSGHAMLATTVRVLAIHRPALARANLLPLRRRQQGRSSVSSMIREGLIRL